MKKIRDFLNKKRKGMTLIELMIVVVIIGIVFAYAFVNAGANTEKARFARAIEDISAISSAAAMYVTEESADAAGVNGALTALKTNLAGAKDALDKKLSKPLADMKDPWGKAYTITVVDTKDEGKITITTGADSPTVTPDGEKLERVLDFSL